MGGREGDEAKWRERGDQGEMSAGAATLTHSFELKSRSVPLSYMYRAPQPRLAPTQGDVTNRSPCAQASSNIMGEPLHSWRCSP